MKPQIAYAILARKNIATFDERCPIYWQKRLADHALKAIFHGNGRIIKVVVSVAP